MRKPDVTKDEQVRLYNSTSRELILSLMKKKLKKKTGKFNERFKQEKRQREKYEAFFKM